MNSINQHNIIIVDDHIVLRDALASLINASEEFNVINVATNGLELIELFKNGNKPHIIILDLNMPGMDGYETARWLFENHPEVKILILTMYDSDIALIRLLQAGVRGFLKKDVHPHELKTALLSILENGYYYSHHTADKLASFFHHNQASLDKALFNNTEIEFLKLASTELTYKEIAQKMHLTPRTIDGFRDNLFDKLNVRSRVGLAIYAVKNGIVTF